MPLVSIPPSQNLLFQTTNETAKQMDYILNGFREAINIILTFQPEFISIVGVSLKVSLISTALAALFGVVCGIWIVHHPFPGKTLTITVLRTLMSLPTVVVGLMVYSILSRRGPLGELGWLYTQTAIIIGQFILSFPIIASLTITAIQGFDQRIRLTAVGLGANPFQSFKLFLLEARIGLLAAVVAGFGRVFAEVGVSMMLGGNIRHYTRTITTAIALETSKGEFAMGIALGLVLLLVAFGLNILVSPIQREAKA